MRSRLHRRFGNRTFCVSRHASLAFAPLSRNGPHRRGAAGAFLPGSRVRILPSPLEPHNGAQGIFRLRRLSRLRGRQGVAAGSRGRVGRGGRVASRDLSDGGRQIAHLSVARSHGGPRDGGPHGGSLAPAVPHERPGRQPGKKRRSSPPSRSTVSSICSKERRLSKKSKAAAPRFSTFRPKRFGLRRS